MPAPSAPRPASSHRPRRPRLIAFLAVAASLAGAAPALAAPTAQITLPSNPLHPAESADFSGRASSASPGAEISSYTWSFGDGTPAQQGSSATHAFATSGQFDVRLEVAEASTTDPSATPETSVSTVRVTVAPRPGASVTWLTPGPNSARFTFTGADPLSTFACRLDQGAWGSCVSPLDYAGLTPGSHRFSVRETTSSGETQPFPTWMDFTSDAPPVPSTYLPPPSFPVVITPPYVPPVTVKVPRVPRVRAPRAPRPKRPVKPVHVGPRNVITPADIVVGSRKNAPHGCADKNPDHPENVSHCGWPRVTGMFFNTGETRCSVCPTSESAKLTIIGTAHLNDLLLGGTGDVKIIAKGGNNVVWADRKPGGPKSQKATITAGNGRNIIYGGPGTNTITVGTGRNVIHAWQGRGSVTCGSRKSVVRMMTRSRKRYKIHGCSTTKGY